MGFGDYGRNYSPVIRHVSVPLSFGDFGRRLAVVAGIGMTLGLAACVPAQMGPTVQVMPGDGKSFDQFQADQTACKAYANDQIAGARKEANQQAVGTALLGAALGAGLGAAGGNAGAGAAAGFPGRFRQGVRPATGIPQKSRQGRFGRWLVRQQRQRP